MDGNRRPVETFVGVGLVVVGALFLAAQSIGLALGQYAWPLFVIAPGLLFFVLMGYFGREAGFLAIPGSIVTASGALLFVTNLFDVWSVWSYAWTLVTPFSVGVGLWIWGAYAHNPELRRAGGIVMTVGLVLFAAFGFFFEVVLGIGALHAIGLSRVVFPAVLVLLGLWLVLRAAIDA